MARFKVRRKFRITNRPGMFLGGEIVSGEIRKGMNARVLVDGGRYQIVPINAIEFLDFPGGRAEVALQLAFAETDAEECFDGICREGDVIDVEDPYSSAHS